MSRKRKATAALHENDNNLFLRYCRERKCRGLAVNVEVHESTETECPICLISFESEIRVIRLNKCRHVFCPICIGRWMRTRKDCPKCRQGFTDLVFLNKPITLEMNWDDLSAHRLCFVDNHPLLMTYLTDFNAEWMDLLKHMISLLEIGCTGIEHLILNKKHVVTKTQNFIIIKSNEDKLRVVFCCLLPNLSIRLVITENAETEVEVDNECADKVIGYLNKQFQACWRVTNQIMNDNSLDRIFVRKFKNYTARLLISGCNHDKLENFHKAPMKIPLQMVEKCNFNRDKYEQLRFEFPLVKMTRLLSINTKNMKCPCKN